MENSKELKELEEKVKKLEKGDMSGEEAAALIDECVSQMASQGE